MRARCSRSPLWKCWKKHFITNINLINMYCDWKLTWLNNHYARKKCHNFKNVQYEKSPPKLKNFPHKLFPPLVTTFFNFALKIEISWAKKVVKPIFETWNVTNDVVVYAWFIQSLIKLFKNMQCKKE